MPLGNGKLSTIYLVRQNTSQRIVALKVFYKHRIKKDGCEHQLKREIETQSHLRHPNILKLFGYFYDESRVNKILEYASKEDLFKILESVKKFDDVKMSTVSAQIY